jgi:hypothetical protein
MFESYALSNGFNYIEVKRNFIYKKEKPYSDCDNDLINSKSHLVKYFFNNNLKYGFKECADLLAQDEIIKTCGCAYLHYKNIYNINYCSTIEEYKCIEYIGYYSEFSFQDYEFLCPKECNSFNLDLTFSTKNHLKKQYIQRLRNNKNVISKYENITNITDETIEESFVSFDVYYNSLSFTQIDEVPVQTTLNIVSNIGGTLGLFLGMSLLSFIEVIELLFNIVIAKINKRLYPSN